MNKKNKRYLVSPYIFSLSCTLLCLMLVGIGIVFLCCMKQLQGIPFTEAILSEEAFCFYFVVAISLAVPMVFSRNAYEYFGTIEICADRVVFRAIFCKPITFLYTELSDIGIDYGKLTENRKQFWIYFAKERIEYKYVHNILSLPFTDNTMRVQYRKELYDALLSSMPNDSIGKRLSRSHSVIRLFHADSEK